MKNCINCNNNLEISTKFCNECGTKQPELPKENSSYSASIGDKNVISGNIIGKSEEFNITGPATINRIEDDTKKFITCAVSGTHLLRGRDIIVNCPKCKSDVSKDCFNLPVGRCFNCDKEVHAQYSSKLDLALMNDGIIDASERMQLDSLALSLMINPSIKQKLESEAREKKASINLNVIGESSNELNGFYKIQFKKAVNLIFESNDLQAAIDILAVIHRENVLHDDSAALLFWAKAIQSPNMFIADYEKKSGIEADVFWASYWAFIPYFKLGLYDQGFKIINLNKARFSDSKNDILFSEVVSYLMLFSQSKESDYLQEAKAVYASLGANVKQPILVYRQLLDKLLNVPESEWGIIAKVFTPQETCFFNEVLGFKSSNSNQTAPSQNNNQEVNIPLSQDTPLAPVAPELVNTSEMPEIDENGNCWVDESIWLRARNNRLFIVDTSNDAEIEYPALLTNRAIWSARSVFLDYSDGENFEWDDKVKKTLNFVHPNLYFCPKGWSLPCELDWDFLSAFIAAKNDQTHPLNVEPIKIGSEICSVGDTLVCIDSGNSQFIETGNEYILLNYQANNIFIYDVANEKFITQQGSSKLVPFGKNRFELSARYQPGAYIVPSFEKEYSFIHPKNSIANKFSIDYKKSNYFTLLRNFHHYPHNGLKYIEYGRMLVTKNDGVSMQRGIESYSGEENDFRLLRPYTRKLINKLMAMGFELPEYLNYNDLIVVDENRVEEDKIEHASVQKVKIQPSLEKSNNQASLESVNKQTEKPVQIKFLELDGNKWTNEFLNVTTFRSGKKIPIYSNSNDWLEACRREEPAMCYYNNNNNNHALYNIYAINSADNLAPEGYRIPELDDFTDDAIIAIRKLKLPRGIRRIGHDVLTGHKRDDFSDERLLGVTSAQDEFQEDFNGEFEDCVCYYFIDEDRLMQNGFWGYPLLLIK